MGKLNGKIALITGGNSGMGFSTAKLFVEEGAQVIITGRRKEELDQATKSIGKNILGIQGDVSKLSDLDNLSSEIQKKYGKLDILFANAGVGDLAPITEGKRRTF